MFQTIRVFLVFALCISKAHACQPPFQAGALQQQMSAPLLSLPTSNGGIVSGVSSQNSPALQQPSISNSIDNELASMESSQEDVSLRFTPYPGYVPPPPPSAVQKQDVSNFPKYDFPTLIQSSEGTGPRAPVDDAALQELGQELSINGPYPPSCSSNMKTIHDVLSCMEFLPNIEQNENSVTCTFEENTSCRFKSSSPSYQVARFPTDVLNAEFSRLAQRTTADRPSGSFLAFVQRNGLPPSTDVVLSTPITCQKDHGNLKFQFWTVGNPNLRLQVCTQDYSVRSCTKPIYYHDSSLVTIQVVHPNSTLFDIEIMLSNIIKPTVFVIDNLTYEADICQESKDDPQQNPLLPTEDVVESFFEEDVSDGGEDVEKLEDSAAVIPARPSNNNELTLPNAEDIVGPPGSVIKKDEDEEKSPSIEGPPGVSPFNSSSRNDGLGIRKINVCQLIDCSFDGTLCSYKNYKNDTFKPSEWSLGSDRVGNPHTGIKNEENVNGGFLYVGTDTNDNSISTYILESPQLNLEEDFLLSLDIYRRSNDITLQICINSPFYCPYTVPSFEKGLYWKTGETFSMTKGTKKFYLKAIQWRKFKWLAIDNIRVSNKDLCSE